MEINFSLNHGDLKNPDDTHFLKTDKDAIQNFMVSDLNCFTPRDFFSIAFCACFAIFGENLS
jgi:hypothetical protein